jgi:HAMP domain-containing protein
LGGFSFVIGTKALDKTSLETQTARLNQSLAEIQDYLDQVDNDLFYLSESSALNLYFSALQSESAVKQRLMLTNLRQSLKKFLRYKPQYLQISFIDSGGMEVVRIENIDGKVKNISDPDLKSQREMVFFKRTIGLQKGDLYMSELKPSRKDKEIVNPLKPLIHYATPIVDKQNNPQGILVVNVDMNRIFQKTASKLPKGMQVFLIDSDGYYLFHPDKGKAWSGKNNLDTGANLLLDKNISKDEFTHTPAINHLKIDEEIISYVPLKINENQRQLGIFIISSPKETIFQPSEQFSSKLIMFTVVLLLLGTIIAYFTSGIFPKSLIAFSEDVERLSMGEIETPIAAASNDEIGELAIAVERLRKSIKFLMKKVEH